MLQSILHWPWYIWFAGGYIFGVIMASWLLGWHVREVELQRDRLQSRVDSMSGDVCKARLSVVKETEFGA